jgi:hypothetical protein
VADDEEFKCGLTEARRVTFQTGVNRVQALTAQAINTLESLMGRETPNVRLGAAARTVAELGIQSFGKNVIQDGFRMIEPSRCEPAMRG